ncbi:MAG TPA: hypothetical protein VNA89_14055 [Gemmatimonadaceae bacterium]|nr:hypothetical protein [Gemmatimonadaceae bacterium]
MYDHQQSQSAVAAWWDVGSAEQVAAALEAVARRVRDGSLPVGEVDAGAGESAAVAAALAALLGVKR